MLSARDIRVDDTPALPMEFLDASRSTATDHVNRPIFDAEGRLAGVLGIGSVDPDLSDRSHALTWAIIENSARAIEEGYFRERFYRDWIVSLASPDAGDAAALFALDADQCIVGADRNARRMLAGAGLDVRELGFSFWDVFVRNVAAFRNQHQGDIRAHLKPVGSSETWLALVTPPLRAVATGSDAETARLHTRPRLDVRGAPDHQPLPTVHARGGLPPRALRRVREYIDAHLEQNVCLEALASVAGLSVHHFSRAFKQSEGVPPHGYLVRCRVGRARKLLSETELSLSEIAIASGFSDQSHFSRQFRQHTGVTPATFRWSKR